MIVENTFVTTLDAPQAMQLAQALLESRGYKTLPQSAFALDGGGAWQKLEMTRGKANAGVNMSPLLCPQRFHMEWDRGRITMANSIETYRARKPKKHFRNLGLTTSSIIQKLLTATGSHETCQQELAQLEETIRRKYFRARVLRGFIIFLFLAGIAAFIYYMSKFK